MPGSAYESLLQRVRDIDTARTVEALLEWDQETYMPPRAAEQRGNQLALIAGIAHESLISDETGSLLARAEHETNGHDPLAATNVRETRRTFDRAVRVPTKLVKDIAKTIALAKEAWIRARQDSNFDEFAPHLSRLLELKREVADRIGWTTEPYDALMDEFEPGAKVAEVKSLFDAVRAQLAPLVAEIKDAPRQPDLTILNRTCPVAGQAEFGRRICQAIGFDMRAGRIDISAHPFCSGLVPTDVRLTTRYDESYLPQSLFGILHETGHGLYEQGLDVDHAGTPMGRAVSLGIHESQSLMWENLVGRSHAFWEHFYPQLQATFPSLADVELDAFYFAINAVRPSFIRVEADDVTYGLHIILRLDIERELISNKLAVRDIPERWNAAMHDLLGITPSSDAQGCLQDIHWSMGIFGYFPTYLLGKLYASQLFDAARSALPDLPAQFARGEFSNLLVWLRENIHRHGKRFQSAELLERVTGAPPSHAPFMRYLNDKFRPLYGI